MRSIVLAALTVMAALPPAVVAGPVSGPDPAVIAGRNGDAGYYVFTTGKGVPMLHSKDLVEWKAMGRVFAEDIPEWAGNAIQGSRDVWAPDISFHNGLYHLYYAVSTFGSQRSVIGLAVNKRLEPGHPDNRWVDRGMVIDSHKGISDFNAIDPALFVDEGGQWILFFGSFWSGIKAVPLDPLTGKPKSNRPVIHPIATRAANVPHRPIEAPFVIKRGDWYYLFVSWDHCCNGAASDYKIMVGRAQSLLGPYVDKSGKSMAEGGGTLVLEGDADWAGPGHNSVLQRAKGDFLVHHAIPRIRPASGRLLFIRRLAWEDDGWVTCGPPINFPGPHH